MKADKQHRILVTDDSPMDRRLCSGLLEDAGYQAETAADGPSALDRLRSGSFDVMLLDVHMPRMTGLQMLEELRTVPQPPRVVMLTSDTTPESVLEAMRQHAYSYLAKPVTAESLIAAVEDALAATGRVPEIEILSASPQWVELLVSCDESTANRMPLLMSHFQADLHEDVREAIGVAFSELLRNAIEWGGGLDPTRKVRIACLRTDRVILYRIADPGSGFVPEEVEHAAIAHPPGSTDHAVIREDLGLRAGGFGILIAQGTVDELIYNEKHNEVVFIKYL